MKLKQQIGLVGGSAMVVGGVIGMGAFVLIPIICAKAGGAAWLAVALALVISLISVLPLIQLSSAFPTAGAGYIYGKKFLSPMAGIIFSWWGIIGGAAAVALVAFGMAESFENFLPQNVSFHVASVFIILAFFLFFLGSTKLLIALQVIMSAQMLLALLMYTIPVLGTYGQHVSFSMPQNSGFLMAVIVAFNICLGFQIIIELGEDMSKPKRNIPLSLIIGATIILAVYLMTIAAYTGVVGLEKLPSKPEMVATASDILPHWAIIFIRIGVINAGLTCFTGAAIAIPREIYTQSKHGVLPARFSRLGSNGAPQAAVILFFAVVILLLLLGELLERTGVLAHFFGLDSIEFYGYLTIIGMMLLTIGVSLAAWRLPTAFPDLYANAYLKFNKRWLQFFILIAIVSSSLLIVLVSTKWIIPLVFCFITFGVYITFRKAHLHK